MAAAKANQNRRNDRNPMTNRCRKRNNTSWHRISCGAGLR
jgi:hypothetical protein